MSFSRELLDSEFLPQRSTHCSTSNKRTHFFHSLLQLLVNQLLTLKLSAHLSRARVPTPKINPQKFPTIETSSQHPAPTSKFRAVGTHSTLRTQQLVVLVRHSPTSAPRIRYARPGPELRRVLSFSSVRSCSSSKQQRQPETSARVISSSHSDGFRSHRAQVSVSARVCACVCCDRVTSENTEPNERNRLATFPRNRT